MGGLLGLTASFAAIPTSPSHGLAQAVILVVLFAGAIEIYAALLPAFGITGWRESLAALRRSNDLPA
jgi:putative peptidoglycan lipid II flippase